MSGFATVIEDADGDTIEVETFGRSIFVSITQPETDACVMLTVDQCATLIAAITDAARVVTGEKA